MRGGFTTLENWINVLMMSREGDEPAVVVAVMRLVGGGEVCFSQQSIMHDKFVCHCGIIISAGTT